MDEYLLQTVNSIQVVSPRFNYALAQISTNPLTKSLPLVALFWGFWFARVDGPYRAKVLAGAIISIAAIVVGRVLAVTLPFRLRPIHDPDVIIIMADHLHANLLVGWNSMPSDHGVFFATMCTCIFMMHRLIGVLIGLYCFLVVLSPRIVFGLHWPSDILVGMVVGVVVAILTLPVLSRFVIERNWLATMTRHEALFYSGMFLLTFQMATMFDSFRQLLKLAASFASYLVTRLM